MSGTLAIAAPDVRRPRMSMRINGKDVPGLLDFTATNNAYQAADTFAAHVTMTAMPPGFGPAYWADTDAIDIELLAWIDGRQKPTSIVRGLVDKVAFSFDQTVVSVSGRDYSSVFIDAKTAEKFADQRIEQIAATLAARHPMPGGAKMQVSAVTTTTPAGDFYKMAHVALTDEVSEWTLLQWLAEQQGLVVWVAGQTLYVQQPPSPTTPPLAIAYQPPTQADPVSRATTVRLEVERVLTLARDIVVVVRSWNHQQKKAITSTRRGTKIRNPGAKDTRQGMPPQTYVFTVPGLTQVQADQYAAAKLAELSRHERTLTVADLPAMPDLTVQRMLRLSGTQTAFDQDYYIAEITRRFGWEGATMEIRAKNSSPRNTVNI